MTVIRSIDLAEAGRRLGAHEQFDVDVKRDRVLGRRVRLLPGRGLLRLLVPRSVVRVRPAPGGVRVSTRPDGLAIFMVVALIGAAVVEFTMDRTRYPRAYPPEFIFGLGAFYFVALCYDLGRSGRAARRLLSAG